jgi:alanine dehydrogenase
MHMRIGVPKEDTVGETRVALTPNAVRALADQGHEVTVEYGAAADGGEQRAGEQELLAEDVGAGLVPALVPAGSDPQ